MPTIEWSLPGAFDEAGSVCLVSDDETDEPEHRRGSFGKPAPGFEEVPTLWVVAADADTVPLSATGKIVKSSLQELLRTRGARAARQQEELAK